MALQQHTYLSTSVSQLCSSSYLAHESLYTNRGRAVEETEEDEVCGTEWQKMMGVPGFYSVVTAMRRNRLNNVIGSWVAALTVKY